MRILAILLISLTLFSCQPIGSIDDLYPGDSPSEPDLGIKSIEDIFEDEGISTLLDFPTILKRDLIQIEGDSLHIGKVFATHDGPEKFLVELETVSKDYAIRNIANINKESVVRPEEGSGWLYFPITDSRQWKETAEDLTRKFKGDESLAIYTGDFYVPGDTLEVNIRKVYSSTEVGVRTIHYLHNGEIVIRKAHLADGRELKIEVDDINKKINVTLKLPGGERRVIDVQSSQKMNKIIFQ